MTDEEKSLLPNPDHLLEVAEFLREINPSPGKWNDWECHARILNVWAKNLIELLDKTNFGPGEALCRAVEESVIQGLLK